MKVNNHIFNRKLLNKQLKNFQINTIPNIIEIKKIISNWQYSIINSDLDKTKEEAVQGDFLTQFFTHILGYKNRYGNSVWNINQEQKTTMDATKADGALGFFTSDINDVRVVIELKDAKTDLDKKQNRQNKITPVEQAFSYASKSGKKCKWIIVSNFKEIRFYHSSTQIEYEKFMIDQLDNDEDLKRFYFLLNCNNLINRDNESLIDNLFRKNEEEQTIISKLFYKDYKSTRINLYKHLKEKNKSCDEIFLFEKSQKLMDRFIFVCFCEDSGLLPENIFRKVIEAGKLSFDLSDTKNWKELKNLFLSIDKGNVNQNVNKFNGGLFKSDPELDKLIITDEIFSELEKIADYDFGSDLNVNILGHIFEQSISDIEEIKAELSGQEFEKNKGKRKKEGIHYTPDYITKYIVEETLDNWLADRKKDLGEDKLPYIPELHKKMKVSEKAVRTRAIKKHIEFWESYREKLANIKILDPACGSGAFLNQAFDYLYKEGQRVNLLLSELKGGQMTFFDLDKHILKNNLYGVDLNKESVEITKLSLWLKTANKNDELTTLDDNIKCGNSLINDSEIAGKFAFSWEEEYKTILSNGGFDIVIGNPPYVRHEYISDMKNHLKNNYEIYNSTADLYTYFLEKGVKLTNENGYLSMIFPNKFMKAKYGAPLRKFLSNHSILKLIDFGDLPLFQDAVTYPMILLLNKKIPNNQPVEACIVKELNIINLNTYLSTESFQLSNVTLTEESWYIGETKNSDLVKKIKDVGINLSDFINAPTYTGIKTGLNDAYIIDEVVKNKLISEDQNAEELIYPYVSGADIRQFHQNQRSEYIILLKKGTDILKYPSILRHMETYKEKLKKRKDIIGKGEWFELRACSYYDLFNEEKIIFPDISPEPRFYLDVNGSFIGNTALFIPNNSKYLLGLLNSKLLLFYLDSLSSTIKGGYYRFLRQYIEKLPIKNLPLEDQLPIINLVEDIINCKEEHSRLSTKFIHFIENSYKPKKVSKKLNDFYKLDFSNFVNELEKQKGKLSEQQKYELIEIFTIEKNKMIDIDSKIIIIEKSINLLVYKIYGLSSIEIQIIEESI